MFKFLQVPKGGSMKMTAFCGIASCSLVELYRRFRGACHLHHQDYHQKSLCTSETPVQFNVSTGLYNSQGYHHRTNFNLIPRIDLFP
jgi:hypothetical protein